ncbi:MAG: PAS domain S-box protein [Promethearchaeota archaeon]|jgi:PAS domain S-box-containing protein
MESTLKNINKINQLISESIEDLVFICNEKLEIEYSKHQELQFGKNLVDFLHPNDSKLAPSFIDDVLESGQGRETFRIIADNNFFKWYEIRGKRFLDGNNQRKIFLICRDITKHKDYEKEIEENQMRYNQLADTLPEIKYWKLLQSKESLAAVQKTREMLELVINNIPQLIYWKDKNLNYLGCNLNFAQIYGFNHPSLIIGRSDRDINWGKDKSDLLNKAERRVMENKKSEYNVVEILSLPNGDQVWYEINRIPLQSAYGTIEGILVTYEDVTERKISEQMLKESEEKYRNLIINLTDIILEIDLKGKVTYVSPQSSDVMGYSPAEIIGESAFKFIHPEDAPKIAESMKEAFQTKETIAIPMYRLLHKNGTIKSVSARGRYVNTNGNERIIGAIRDITIQKQIEEKLKESEESYRTIFDASPDYIYVTDVEGNLLDANKSLLNRIGITLEELKQTKFIQYFAGDDIETLMKTFEELTLGKEIRGIEVRAKNVHGETFEYEVNSVPLKKDGKVTRILNLARDITDKKDAEHRLKESENKYRHLFESSPYSIVLINRRGEIIDCNPTTERIFQKKTDELLGRNFLDFNWQPDIVSPIIEKRYHAILEGIESKPLEIQINRSGDHRLIWININDSMVEVGDETVFQVIIQDITEHKIAEEQLKLSQQELKVLNRELEQKVRERTEDLIESERQYRTTIDSLGDSMHVVNKDLDVILVNQALKKWLAELKVNPDIIDKNLFKVFPFLPPIIAEEYKQVFKTGDSLVTTETTILPEINVITETRKIPIFSGKDVDQVITIIRDITESKEIENQLKISEEKFRNMVNNLDVAFYKGKYKSQLLMHNQAFNTVLGFNPEQSAVGADSNEFFINKNRQEKYYEELEKKGFVRNFLAQIKKFNGDIITVDLNAHVIYDSEGGIAEVEGTFSDITEKFKLQQDLLESEKKLREKNIELMKLDEVKNDFITMAAHELKTPSRITF